MDGRILPEEHQLNSPANTANTKRIKQQSLQQAQEVIYKYFIGIVSKSSPETVLLELKQLLFFYNEGANSDVINALSKIILNNDEELFRNTLKRICYILINNWSSNQKYKLTQELITLLADAAVSRHTPTRSLNYLRTWLSNFIKSEDYQDIKLFASPFKAQENGWSHRYTSFLLVPQYLDSNNSLEQRELARNLSKRLKEKFKFELAMYTARCDSPILKKENPANPTRIGNEVICLIKEVVPKRLSFSYETYAHLLSKQIYNYNYLAFKQSLNKYLIFSVSDQNSLKILKKQLYEKLNNLYTSHHQETLSVDLLLRSCRRLIDFLTTEDGQNPSSLFILLNTQGSTITLVVTLLKIILICKYAQNHLEVCIAKLIRYYENYPEQECQWFIKFLEIFNIVFAIYTENVQYNLVLIKDNALNNQSVVNRDAYRVFPQLKGADLRGTDLSSADLRGTNFSAADLRGVNLSGTDLTQANLSLAKLSRANLSNAMLSNAELVAADLNSAQLSGASLTGADLRRADLRQANLNSADLTAAKLRRADLTQADLSRARLSSVNLNASNLTAADLRFADLQQADLSEANLSEANLSNANLSGAKLSHANLQNANLSGANLSGANLSGANLSGANLTEANLNRAVLDHVNLRGTDLNGAILRCANLTDANLSGANLSHADLSHADLSNGELSGTDLSYAFLRHVNLSSADLSDANLNGANLFSTNLSSANVKGTQFKNNSGLPKGANLALEVRGAIFEV